MLAGCYVPWLACPATHVLLHQPNINFATATSNLPQLCGATPMVRHTPYKRAVLEVRNFWPDTLVSGAQTCINHTLVAVSTQPYSTPAVYYIYAPYTSPHAPGVNTSPILPPTHVWRHHTALMRQTSGMPVHIG